MTTPISHLLLPLSAGVGVGLFYFWGLWWTVRLVADSRHPYLWLMGSFAVRTAFSLTAFYLVMGKDWVRLLFCILGFMVVRIIATRPWGPPTEAIQPRRS